MAQPVTRPKKSVEMRIRLPIYVTERSQIANLPSDTQIFKWRTTWRNLPSIFLIQRNFDYLPRFFSVSQLEFPDSHEAAPTTHDLLLEIGSDV